MSKFFHNLFYVPKYGKMKESAFFAHLTASVVVILLSLVAMSFSAFAYFSSSLTTTTNTIVAANYNCNVIIKQNDQIVQILTLGSENITLPQGIYQITVTQVADDKAASTGFCVLEINGQRYYTAQISMSQGLSFELEVQQPEQTFEMYSHWGTSTYYVTEQDKLLDKSPFYIIQESKVILSGADDGQPEEDDEIPAEPEVTEHEGTEAATQMQQ